MPRPLPYSMLAFKAFPGLNMWQASVTHPFRGPGPQFVTEEARSGGRVHCPGSAELPSFSSWGARHMRGSPKDSGNHCLCCPVYLWTLVRTAPLHPAGSLLGFPGLGVFSDQFYIQTIWPSWISHSDPRGSVTYIHGDIRYSRDLHLLNWECDFVTHTSYLEFIVMKTEFILVIM